MDTRLSDYARQLIPNQGEIVFLFKEDFDGDGMEEAVIGYTLWGEYSHAHLFVLQLKITEQGGRQARILSTAETAKGYFNVSGAGAYDAAYAADTNGDGLPELVISLSSSSGLLTPLVIHWLNGKPRPFFTTHESFAHGRLHVLDMDGDGVYEIIVEESISGDESEIINALDTGPHMGRSIRYSWNGIGYEGLPASPLQAGDRAFNTAAAFLLALHRQDYASAFEKVMIPAFLGLRGVDDDAFESFVGYAEKSLLPGLKKNLQQGRLTAREATEHRCVFCGSDNCFIFHLALQKGHCKILGLDVVPQRP